MKRHFIHMVAVIILIGCSDSEHRSAEHKSEHKQSTGKLTLNNGEKWKADSSTVLNVRNLQTLIEGSGDSENEMTGDYQAIGKELQTGIDKLIADCKMKGPDHDALHNWLLPLIDEVSKLNSSATRDEAAVHFREIKRQTKLFNEYFE